MNKGFAEISREDLEELLFVPLGISIKDIIHLTDPTKDIYIINLERQQSTLELNFKIDEKGVWRNV